MEIESRVTGWGEFSPLWSMFIFGLLYKNFPKLPKMFGYFCIIKSYVKILHNVWMGVGADFCFSQNHPVALIESEREHLCMGVRGRVSRNPRLHALDVNFGHEPRNLFFPLRATIACHMCVKTYNVFEREGEREERERRERRERKKGREESEKERERGREERERAIFVVHFLAIWPNNT
jgi:hypothetical protein